MPFYVYRKQKIIYPDIYERDSAYGIFVNSVSVPFSPGAFTSVLFSGNKKPDMEKHDSSSFQCRLLCLGRAGIRLYHAHFCPD